MNADSVLISQVSLIWPQPEPTDEEEQLMKHMALHQHGCLLFKM